MTGKIFLLPVMLATLAAPLSAHSGRQDYPSCNLAQQRALKAPIGGTMMPSRFSQSTK